MLNNSFSLDAITVQKVDIRDVAVDALHALSVSVGWSHSGSRLVTSGMLRIE